MHYKLLPKTESQSFSDLPVLSESTDFEASVSSEFLSDAVFAAGSFWEVEAAYGRVDGVVKTVAGYCGGTFMKPTYTEVSEGKTGHTEAVKVSYDRRRVSYSSLCNTFWEIHDPTNKEYLNFGVSTHKRSAIFYSSEEERKQAQVSKIRRQMKLDRRIVTRIIPLVVADGFYAAENRHQKYYLQNHYRLCESLNLRSTDQFAASGIACRLNGILSMDEKLVGTNLTTLVKRPDFPRQSRAACEEIVQDLLTRIKDNT